MSAAVAYEDIYGRNGEKFERLFRQTLDEVGTSAEWRVDESLERLQQAASRLIPRIANLAFMVMLSAKDGITVHADLISRLRNIYSELNNDLLDSPGLDMLDKHCRKDLENVTLELASAICALDMCQSEKIAAIFSGREIHA